jgi:energy-coupling factor transporter ATP-binding protein EcfA2
MADFTFSFTHSEDIDNLLTGFGIDADGSQSETETIPDDTASVSNQGEQDHIVSKKSSWVSEDDLMHNVPEPSQETTPEEVDSYRCNKGCSTHRSPSPLYRTFDEENLSLPSGPSIAQSANDHLLRQESNLGQNPVSLFPQSPTEDHNQRCGDCEIQESNISYCNACSLSFCEPCWNRNPCHRMTHRGIPHEKTPKLLAQKTDAVFDPDIRDGPEREELHCKDVFTSWFGIHREDTARPLLQDYGRFESLMATMRQSSDNGFPRSDASARYPSFVSFVGQTGAGKSSLIKLIIDLGAKTNEQFDTPVVSAKGNTCPTSSDVHLYMDPPTSTSSHPILYADCEGLEGGEREPVAETLKKRTAKANPNVFDHPLQPISERDIIWADEPWRRSRAFAVKELYPRLLYTFSDVIVFVLRNSKQVQLYKV